MASCASPAAASSGRPIEAALPELRLALGREVHQRVVVLEDVQNLEHGVKRLLEPLRPDQLEVVGGRVVLGKLALERAREAAYGQVESRRVVLPLIPAPRDEVEDSSAAAADDVRARAVDKGVPPPAPFVRQRPGVAHTGDDKAGHDLSRRASFRASQAIEPIVPWDEEESVRELPRPVREHRGELGEERDPGEIVVRERGVAHVGAEQDLVLALPGKEALAVRQRSGRERAVDDDLVERVVLELVERPRRQAEPPRARVVRRPVRDPVPVLVVHVQELPELVERHRRPHRLAVGDHVQVRLC